MNNRVSYYDVAADGMKIMQDMLRNLQLIEPLENFSKLELLKLTVVPFAPICILRMLERWVKLNKEFIV